MVKEAPPYKELVFVPYSNERQKTAIVLIGSALEKGYDKRVVRTTHNGFLAPQDVVDLAFSGKTRGRKGSRRELAPTADFDTTGNEKE